MEVPNRPRPVHPGIRIALVIGLVFVFLVAVKLVGSTFKELGEGDAEALLQGIRNPFAALSIGILATVIVQSSSATTAMIVLIVSEGQMPIEIAVYAIMGCNIGTTVTNTLVSMGHIRQASEFQRAFAGATMHDFFNLMAIAILMPIEMTTGIIYRTAVATTGAVEGWTGGTFESPIKTIVGSTANPIKDFVFHDLGLSSALAGTLALAIAVTLVFVALVYITRNMRALMANRLEQSLNAVLAKSGVLSIVVGAVATVSVQSSSITTSLMIPLFGAGILRLENGFPVTIGANIGTTVTAFIAALAGNVAGLTIATVHLLFNLTATLIIYPFPVLRNIPLRLARGLALRASTDRRIVLYYVIGVFVVAPLIGVWLFN
ncbi:MAG: sodium dependent phosphate transporter [Planctomycetes bacterium]|jgi:sodium-dependent phosphate cotransporter|nr:sodium dependent phosphate transporter [Planctomycetota bacterium]MDP6423235.1 Na/Pi symporter [Planctomycetota bacterium]